MMGLRIQWAIIGLLIIVLGVACSNTKADQSAARNMRNDANATLDKVSDTLGDASKAIQLQMDQFRHDMGVNLAGVDTKLQQLQAKRDAMADAKAKEALDARLTQLQKERDALQLRIDHMDSQEKDQASWKKFQDDTQSAWHDLENGVKDAIDKLGG
jgi:prophage DNA circulation protein